MSSPAKLSDFEDNLLPNNANDDDEADASEKRRIDPESSQKRNTRDPQPTLNAERLKGPKGIHTIEQHFADFKFHGKGHEKGDLNRLMKKLEYWSHRLFPKYEFDDFLARLETLGAKKPVQTHLTKIRLGMLTDDIVIPDDAGEENQELVEDSAPIDEFDALIAEELEKKRSAVTPQGQNVSFLSTSLNKTPIMVHNVPSKTTSLSSDIEITTEMKERMERNRQIAIQKRLARIDAEEAEKRALREQVERNETPMEQEMNEQTPPEESIASDSIGENELQKERFPVTPKRQNLSFVPTSSNQTPTIVENVPPKTPSRLSNIEITTEMNERMERNRQIAIQKKLARINAEKAKKEAFREQVERNEVPMEQEMNEQIPPKENIASDSIGEKE